MLSFNIYHHSNKESKPNIPAIQHIDAFPTPLFILKINPEFIQLILSPYSKIYKIHPSGFLGELSHSH
jgi:hypothetical protein